MHLHRELLFHMKTSMLANSSPTLTSAGHQRTGSTSTRCNQWLSLAKTLLKSITTHPQKRMNSTYIVSGGPQKCPTHPAKRMNSTGFGVRSWGWLANWGHFEGRSSGPKTKKEPPKQQRTNSIFLSDFQGANEIHFAFVLSLFYHHVYKSWVGHSACKPTQLNLLWGWSTLPFVGWVVMP